MRRNKIAKLADVLRVSPLLIMGDDDFCYAQLPPTSEELNLIDDYRILRGSISPKNNYYGLGAKYHGEIKKAPLRGVKF